MPGRGHHLVPYKFMAPVLWLAKESFSTAISPSLPTVIIRTAFHQYKCNGLFGLIVQYQCSICLVILVDTPEGGPIFPHCT